MMTSFVYITISCQMLLALMKTYKLKLLHSLHEKADFQKLFHFTDIYLLCSKMQIKSLKPQAELDCSINGVQHF